MFRITTNRLPSLVEFIVDGDLSTECAAAVDRFCQQAENAANTIVVKLRDIQAINQAGRDLIVRLLRAGIRVNGAGLYTTYLIDECRKHCGKKPDA